MSCVERISTTVLDNGNVLGASQYLGSAVDVRGDGFASVHLTVDDGAGGAPSDSPSGQIELLTSADGVNYVPVATFAGPTGTNVVIQKVGLLTPPPTSGGSWTSGRFLRARYLRTSGGGGDSRATVTITTW